MANDGALRTGDLDLDEEVPLEGSGFITVRELYERVSLVEPCIILMREINKPTPATLTCLFQAVERLADDCDAFGLVVDLMDTSGGGADYRRFIPKRFSALHESHGDKLKLIAVASTGNVVSRVATKFVVGRMTQMPFAVESSRENAVQAVRKALGRTS